jgi:S-adenosylmethionine:tRNA ribosyltransferase-isomerase
MDRAEVTLHVGLDTFRPVTVEHIRDHRIHREWCSVPAETARAIAAAKRSGRRVVAVGTTTARTLEAWSEVTSLDDPVAWTGMTGLFIVPGYRWRVVDALLSNFHLPRSTLLMMVSALAGIEPIRAAYAEAIVHRYRFYSFGDAMLIR